MTTFQPRPRRVGTIQKSFQYTLRLPIQLEVGCPRTPDASFLRVWHRGEYACTSKFITCYVTLNNKAVTAGANQIPMGWPVAPRKERTCSGHNLSTLSQVWLTTQAPS